MATENIGQPVASQGSPSHESLLGHLSEFVTAGRLDRLRQVLALRTRRLTVVLDGIKHDHNISAVMRSCDAFGVQDLHLIEGADRFSAAAKVAMGSQRWLSLHRYEGEDASAGCVETLKSQGYQLVATGPPGPGTESFDEISLNRPLALVFGNERNGLSPAMRAGCEGMISIPMQGFVESLNISVAAAIIVQNLTTRLRASKIDWPLTDVERQTLLLDWVRKSISAVRAIEQRWIEDQRRRAQANPPTAAPGRTP